jgi:hypothetical protein
MRIRDPGSGMGKIRIRDKHVYPGSAKLTVRVIVLNDKILKKIFRRFCLGNSFLVVRGSLNTILAKLSFGI